MFRSQMAEAIAGQIIGQENVMSAGTYTGALDEPEGLVLKNLSTIYKSGYQCFDNFLEFMSQKGLDIGNNKTKKVTDSMISWADVVVDMAEDSFNPDFLKSNPKVVHWDIENNASKFDVVYPDLFQRIRELVSQRKNDFEKLKR